MSIRLALDIDGVLSDQFGKMEEIAVRYGITDKSWKKEYNGIWKVYDKDNVQLAKRIFEDNLEEFILDQKPIEGSKEGFDKLLDLPNTIVYITTSRHKENKDLTLRWLDEHGFTGVEDVLFLEDKLKAPTNVIIDDKIGHVESYINNARMGIIYTQPYNTKYETLNRVSNLIEAKNLLMKYV